MPKGYYFDRKAADEACEFFPRFLRFFKGKYAGRPFELEPWQRDITRRVFGWKRCDTGFRKHRTVWIEIPKKNGKSTLAGGFAVKLTVADHEPGAEVYSAAASKEQAQIVFDSAANMVKMSPRALRKRIEVRATSLFVPRSFSSYKVISSLAATKHGLDVSGLVIDEVHAHKDRALIDALEDGTASRRQPLTIYLTTAGVDRNSIGYEKHDYAVRLLEGNIEDPTFLPIIFAAGADDDVADPRVWRKANPNYGISVTPESMQEKFRQAQLTPAKMAIFRQLRLNQWMHPHQRAIDLAKWKRGALPINVRALHGRPCWGGLDLASKRDLASFALVFPLADGGYILLVWSFVPHEGLVDRVKNDRVPYDVWRDAGFIVETPGDDTDYGTIRRVINDCGRRFDIREIAIDRWDATLLRQQLSGDGFEMVQFGQGYQSMTEPSKQFDVSAHNGGLIHGANPVVDWAAGNLVWKKDAAGNYKPDKDKSIEKIDPIVAGIMALGRCMARVPDPRGRYDKGKGIRTVAA